MFPLPWHNRWWRCRGERWYTLRPGEAITVESIGNQSAEVIVDVIKSGEILLLLLMMLVLVIRWVTY